MLGHVVSPGDVLFKLNRQNRLEWHAELPVSELGLVQIGQRVTLDIPGQAQARGQVRQIAPTVDKSSRNALVYVDLERHSGVRAGTFASGNIILGKTQALAVPQSALLLQDGFSYVFRIGEQDRVKQVRVTTGQRHDGWVEITRGVTREDVLVAAGVGFLSEGDRVRVVPPQPENAALSPIASPSLSTWPEGGK